MTKKTFRTGNLKLNPNIGISRESLGRLATALCEYEASFQDRIRNELKVGFVNNRGNMAIK
jgi:hypothetical protein